MHEKLDKMLDNNLTDAFKEFKIMGENLNSIKARGEEIKDERITESIEKIEEEQDRIKYIITSSFQQMKEYLKISPEGMEISSDSSTLK